MHKAERGQMLPLRRRRIVAGEWINEVKPLFRCGSVAMEVMDADSPGPNSPIYSKLPPDLLVTHRHSLGRKLGSSWALPRRVADYRLREPIAALINRQDCMLRRIDALDAIRGA